MNRGFQYSVEAPARVSRAAAPTERVQATNPAVPKSHHAKGDSRIDFFDLSTSSVVHDAEYRLWQEVNFDWINGWPVTLSLRNEASFGRPLSKS